MDPGWVAPVALAAALLALVAVAVAIAWGRGLAAGAHRASPESLAELRGRIDALLEAQRDIPRSLAEGSAIQARSLADVRDRLADVAAATQRLEHVGATVSELHEILRVPKLRGTTGEIWLEEALAEVLPASHYEREFHFRSGERVDAIVRLRDRVVPIDAKFPLEAFQRMRRTNGEAAERERRAFLRALRARIDEIAEKYIRPDEGTYEFALMYVPAESVYYEAVLRADDVAAAGETVVQYALSRKVFPVSPNTLYAYLSALVYGLRGLEVEEHTQEILDGLGALRQEYSRFHTAFTVAGKHLTNAARQYEDAERRSRLIGERLDHLGSRG